MCGFFKMYFDSGLSNLCHYVHETIDNLLSTTSWYYFRDRFYVNNLELVNNLLGWKMSSELLLRFWEFKRFQGHLFDIKVGRKDFCRFLISDLNFCALHFISNWSYTTFSRENLWKTFIKTFKVPQFFKETYGVFYKRFYCIFMC